MVIKRFAIFESLFMQDTLITYADPRCMQGACSLMIMVESLWLIGRG